MLKNWNSVLCALLLAGAFTPSPAEANSGQSAQVARKRWHEDLRLGLFGWSYGPAFGQFTSGRGATPSGELGSPVTVGTQFNLSAPAGFGDYRYTAVDALTWSPFERETGTSIVSAANPAFGLAGTALETQSFSWWGRYEISPAVTTASQEAGQIATIRAIKSLGYKFGPKQRWSLGAFLVPAVTFLQDGSSNSFYIWPSINYASNDKVTWTIFVESAWSRAKGDSLLNWSKAMDPNLAFGPTVTFNSGYWLQPFLNVYPGGKINTDSAHLGLYFGGRLL
jgi:hypothetical protein